jgi:5-methylcytosine-specific restriction endonuclease McrA
MSRRKHAHADEVQAPRHDTSLNGLGLFDAVRSAGQLERRFVPAAVRRYVFVRDGGVCRQCRCDAAIDRIDVDHIVALSRGGTNAPLNLRLLCAACNAEKRDHDITPLDQRHIAENMERWRRADPPHPKVNSRGAA